ncbi:MAG: hypothetical protein WCX73_03225 [Candidatus Pacearchaeota archaeon]|jgi:hypothetical protein
MEKEDNNSEKEKTFEDIEVEKNEEKIKSCDKKEIEPSKKEQIKSENKILKKIFIGIGLLIIIFIATNLVINNMKNFEYKGINFNVIKDTGGLVFYHLEERYNLRKDPRRLEDIPFEGEIKFTPINKLVYNSTGFNCDGDGVIAVGNFALILHDLVGIDMIKDENATCDLQGRYMFVQVQPGNETSIKQIGPACYELNVNNCEILDVTEKFLVETLVRLNELKEK